MQETCKCISSLYGSQTGGIHLTCLMMTQIEALLEEWGRSLNVSEIQPGWSKDHNENPVDISSQPKQIKEQLEAVFSFTETM